METLPTQLSITDCHSVSAVIYRTDCIARLEDVELDRGRPLGEVARSEGDSMYPMEKDGETCTPSCLEYFSAIRPRSSASDTLRGTRNSTMASSRMTFTVKLSPLVELDPGLVGVWVSGSVAEGMDGEISGVQGRWNCPGGRFWNGLGKRSGAAVRTLKSFARHSLPGLCGRSSSGTAETRNVGSRTL